MPASPPFAALNARQILAGAVSAFCALLVASCAREAPPADEAGPGEINIYSARHYSSDKLIYDGFTAATGVRVNTIEAKAEVLIEKLKAEGAQSPADVILTVDAGNLWRAQQAGLFQPLQSSVLEAAIPAHERHPDGLWFGFSKRARIIVYDRTKVDPAQLTDYFALAAPRWKGKICARSSGNIYNLSLMSMMIAHYGADRAAAWARGVAANFAREPTGGDVDQIKAVADGVCELALVNHYYWVRMARSSDEGERAAAAKTAIFFPDQAVFGAHVNIAGAGMAAHAPNRDNARKFLEYLATPQVQAIFARENNEFPVVAGAAFDNPELAALQGFKEDELPAHVLGENQAQAQKIFDEAGWR